VEGWESEEGDEGRVITRHGEGDDIKRMKREMTGEVGGQLLGER
jgi:hypothetical protein